MCASELLLQSIYSTDRANMLLQAAETVSTLSACLHPHPLQQIYILLHPFTSVNES